MTAKNLAIIRRMKMALGTLLCLEHSLEAFPALQRVEIAVGICVSQAAEYLDDNTVPVGQHARLSIGKLDIENAFAILCAEHPKSQVMFGWSFLQRLQRESDPKGKPTCLAKSKRD